MLEGECMTGKINSSQIRKMVFNNIDENKKRLTEKNVKREKVYLRNKTELMILNGRMDEFKEYEKLPPIILKETAFHTVSLSFDEYDNFFNFIIVLSINKETNITELQHIIKDGFPQEKGFDDCWICLIENKLIPLDKLPVIVDCLKQYHHAAVYIVCKQIKYKYGEDIFTLQNIINWI